MDDVFEPVYLPRKIEFWLDHWEELDTLVQSPKSAAHIAEHLAREWWLLQVRLRTCLCKEMHAVDAVAVDPACAHMPGGGTGFKSGVITALCISADLRQAADALPPTWQATHDIWRRQMIPDRSIQVRVIKWMRESGRREREPVYARDIAIRRMALSLGWQPAKVA